MRSILKKSYRISFAAMFLALTVITLYLASILPSGTLGLYFLSSIFTAPLLSEREPGLACMLFIGASVLSLLFMTNLLLALPYVFLFGHYGIGKYYIERMRGKWKAFLVKLLYYNAALALIYLTCFQLIAGETLLNMSKVLLIVIAEVSFIVFDFLYSKVALFYEMTLRNRLMRD